MKTFRVTIHLNDVKASDDDDETVKEAVKGALQAALRNDDTGEEDLDFNVEEIEEEF